MDRSVFSFSFFLSEPVIGKSWFVTIHWVSHSCLLLLEMLRRMEHLHQHSGAWPVQTLFFSIAHAPKNRMQLPHFPPWRWSLGKQKVEKQKFPLEGDEQPNVRWG